MPTNRDFCPKGLQIAAVPRAIKKSVPDRIPNRSSLRVAMEGPPEAGKCHTGTTPNLSLGLIPSKSIYGIGMIDSLVIFFSVKIVISKIRELSVFTINRPSWTIGTETG